MVTLEEIASNDYNLNIPRYVEPIVEEEVPTVEEALQRLGRVLRRRLAEERLIAILSRRACCRERDRVCSSVPTGVSGQMLNPRTGWGPSGD